MQPSKPVRAPLTVVGVVSNVVALTLVCVFLYAGPRFRLPPLERVVDSITQIAKTKKLTPDDLVEVLGKPQSYWDTNGIWHGTWQEMIGQNTSRCDWKYELEIFFSIPEEENIYLVCMSSNCTSRSGFEYIYKNLARVVTGGSLFPFEPYYQFKTERLILHIPK